MRIGFKAPGTIVGASIILTTGCASQDLEATDVYSPAPNRTSNKAGFVEVLHRADGKQDASLRRPGEHADVLLERQHGEVCPCRWRPRCVSGSHLQFRIKRQLH